MKRKLLLTAAGAAAAVFITYGSAQAAPASAALDSLRLLGLEQSSVDQVRRRCYRRCWGTRRGWRCRRWCRRRRW